MNKGGISEFAVVERGVRAGTMLLWIAADTRTILAAAVHRDSAALDGERLQHHRGLRYGKAQRARWLPLRSALETFARAEGCRAIRILGRRGWARALPDYKLTRILLEKELT